VVGSGNGLSAIYYDNMDFSGASITRVDSQVNFDWGNGSPNAAIAPDTFSARWTGQVQAQHSQTYTFYAKADDGVRLWVNGQLLADGWKDQGPTEYSGSIALVAGQKYDIKVEYYENSLGAVAQLSWSSASTPKQVIPQSQLYSTVATSRRPRPHQVPLCLQVRRRLRCQRRLQYRRRLRYRRQCQRQHQFPTPTPTPVPGTGPVVGSGNGLLGTYFDNGDLTSQKLTRVDRQVNFNWGDGSPNNGHPSTRISSNTFSVRWSGQVQAQYSQPTPFMRRSMMVCGCGSTVSCSSISGGWSKRQPSTRAVLLS
jgi:hypothetical protein